MDSLKKALACGYGNIEWVKQDPDLLLLRDDPEFQKLVERGQGRLSGFKRIAAGLVCQLRTCGPPREDSIHQLSIQDHRHPIHEDKRNALGIL